MMDSRQLQINKNLEDILARLDGRAGLVAVSKTYPAKDVELAYLQGQRDFGENKVQDLLDKSLDLQSSCPKIHWHFIGKLQSNKINQLLRVPNLVSIHSIDSIKLLNKLLSKNVDKKIGLFLQYNTSGEKEKGGFESLEELLEAKGLLGSSESFYLQGLMTMGSIRSSDFEKSAKECFSQLRELSIKLGQDSLELSMGMSQDFEIALEEGSSWVRVGSAIFGKRD